MSTNSSDLEDTNQSVNLNPNPESVTPSDPDKTEGEDDTETAGTDLTGVSIHKDTSSESVNFSGPDYSTSFCRPRQIEYAMGTTVSSWILKIARTFDIGGVSWYPHIIAVGSFGTILLIVFLWSYMMYSDLIIPFLTGGMRLLWYGFIFFLIISVLILLIHFLYYIAYFFEITVHYFNLTVNPLLDERVSSACCFFSDYVNGMIYYPSMVYFLVWFVVLVVFDVFVLLPMFLFSGFLIGYLFSLLGKRADVSEVKGQFSDIMNNSQLNNTLKNSANQIQGSFNKLKGVLNTSVPTNLLPSVPLPSTPLPSIPLPPFPSIQSLQSVVKSDVKSDVK